MADWKRFLWIVVVFFAAYFMPFENPRLEKAIMEGFFMLQEYAREHVLLCLVPALFIAGAMASFLSQGAVIRYFGQGAKAWVSYGLASVSGLILAVCSCTVLPLFAGIYKRGAGIGPAVAFLYSGPAINILALILTARILGWQLGIAQVVGAVLFSIVIGLIMAFLYRKQQGEARSTLQVQEQASPRTGGQNVLYFLTLVFILVFAAWGRPEQAAGFFHTVFTLKWPLTLGLLAILALMVVRWFAPVERVLWLETTWDFAKQILPLLFAGVLVAGFLMGRPEGEAGLIPEAYVAALVGGNSLGAILTASVLGTFMYFATLTELPILQGLLGAGMGQGPALALLLAGPALSLPSILVIRSVLGTEKTAVFVGLVIGMATISGAAYGWFFA